MAYLGVGIHENVVLSSKTAINDKGSIVLELETKTDATDLLGAFDSGESLEPDAVSLIMWPINMTNWEGKAKSASEVGQDLNNLKNTFVDILEVFMTSDKAKAALGADAMFKGLGINAETQSTLPTKLLQEGFVKSVYTNICTAFIEAAKPFMDTNRMRIKLRRTSTAKHYAMIPPRGKYKETWIESMEVPTSASQVKWSKYELDKGLNSGAKAETDAVHATEAARVASMFDTPAAVPSTPIPPAPAATTNPFNQ